jgi:hypothetical protein
MSSPLTVLVTFAAIELVGVAGLGAWLARRVGLPYGVLTSLAFVVYCAAGFFGAPTGVPGAAYGGAIALLDSAAWATIDGIGAQPRDPKLSWGARLRIIVFVTALGAISGLLGQQLAS